MNNPDLPARDLFRSGMNIGKDAMGTMANTLILAFAGASFNTLLLFQVYGYPSSKFSTATPWPSSSSRAWPGRWASSSPSLWSPCSPPCSSPGDGGDRPARSAIKNPREPVCSGFGRIIAQRTRCRIEKFCGGSSVLEWYH